MEWLTPLAEVLLVVGSALGALVTFTAWNVTQGNRIKALEEGAKELKDATSEKFKEQAADIAALRAQQDIVVKTLTDELRRIGEKLAHIEGFLMRKPASKR